MTHPPSVADPVAFTVTRRIRIAAPIEAVWSAVTEPQHIARWFGSPELDGTGAGAVGTISWPDRDPIPLRVEAFDPPHRVTYRWANDDASDVQAPTVDEHATEFTFTLTPAEGGTELTVVETGFENTSDPLANLEYHRGGWDSELDKLVALLEARP